MTLISPKRPAVRYHGSKWRLAPWVISHFPVHQCYVEPYGGGGAVLLRKARTPAEVYNDLDSEVVSLFRVLRDPSLAQTLAHACRLTPFARDEQIAAYEPCTDPVEQARRLVVRSYMGVSSNAGTRVSRPGFRRKRTRKATPAQDWASWPENISAVTERLRGVVIENRPALEIINVFDSSDTLFYVDPPYPRSERTCDHASYRHEMTDQDHRCLAEVLRKVRGMVVLSGYSCPLYDELYPDWPCYTKPAHTDRASMRIECLWLNSRAQRQQKP